MKKFAIITGASRGIGYAVAEYFAAHDYDLALIARDPHRLDAAKQQLVHTYPQCEITTLALDVAQAQMTYAKVRDLVQARGQVDVLFNNAGIAMGGCDDVSVEDFAQLMAVNANGLFAVAKAVAEVMKQQRRGYIFNVSSIAGKRAYSFVGAYGASKYAVTGFSEALCKTLAPYGVKVTALCPGAIATDMTKNMAMPNEVKIQVEDIVTTVDYLLALSPNAVIPSIDIECNAMIVAENADMTLPD